MTWTALPRIKTALAAGATALLALTLCSCLGGGGLVTGGIVSAINLVGPLVGLDDIADVALNAELRKNPSGELVRMLTLTDTLPDILQNKRISFNFDDLLEGSYKVVVLANIGGLERALFTQVVEVAGHGAQDVSGSGSLTGAGPFATVAGIVNYTGTVPAEPIEVFIGFTPSGQSIPLRADQAFFGTREGQPVINYTIPGVAAGSYHIGLYGADPGTSTLTTYGVFAGEFIVTEGDTAQSRVWANVDFAADFPE